MSSGYSGTSLLKKLGIKAGMRVCFVNAPPNYLASLGDLPPDVDLLDSPQYPLDLIQYFTKERAAFIENYFTLKSALVPNGALWISWPKKAAKIPSDMTEDVIRDFALANGLVDVKVIAVDADWSGLKLVYRLTDRSA
ncbi:MAG: DUF3052 domain-containing protein [Chitinophagaceae bacterium]|nr:DUF3052 domain-containing protein [Anaerolineae bacterium]